MTPAADTHPQTTDPEKNDMVSDSHTSTDQDELTGKRGNLPKIVLGILLIFMLAGALYYFLVYRYFESTDNAYVKADVTWVSPRVSGEILQLNIENNQQVKAGQVLMRLDDRDTQARYQQAEAVANLKNVALDMQKQSVVGQQAMIVEAQASLEAAQAEASRLSKDLARYQQLLREEVTTRQRVEAVQAQYLSAEANVKKAAAAVEAARAQLAQIQTSREQMVADVNSAQANVRLIGVDASSADVIAPVSGVIGNLGVRLGSRVNPQTRLLAIVPLDKVYVEANFKETQITDMHVGQKVSIKLDAYPDATLKGHIDSFSPASGAEFSLMPPENATGNFNKVVQRVPVKILIDREKGQPLIRPGLSAVVKVDLRS